MMAPEALDVEQELANQICTLGHGRPADQSEGLACQECYDIACQVLDTDWFRNLEATLMTRLLSWVLEQRTDRLPLSGMTASRDEPIITQTPDFMTQNALCVAADARAAVYNNSVVSDSQLAQADAAFAVKVAQIVTSGGAAA